MSWKSILKDDKGLGDTVSRITKRLGIKECGGCKKRKAKLNKLIKYDESEEDAAFEQQIEMDAVHGTGYYADKEKWTLHLWTYNKWYGDEMDPSEETFTGTLEEAREWAVERLDNYDASAEIERYYGGSGFTLDDERGKTWMTEKDV